MIRLKKDRFAGLKDRMMDQAFANTLVISSPPLQRIRAGKRGDGG